MPDYHELAELAPRDIVARAIVSEMTKTGTDRVFLDIAHLPAERITARFPQIYRHCLDHGVDMTKEPIPVSPAAHYMMGGVRTNTWGETSVPGLYACGEVACTGVHGANRLASNSLLETVVFAKRIIQQITNPSSSAAVAPAYDGTSDLVMGVPPRDSCSGDQLSRSALQELLWSNVGIVRNGEGLTRAASQLASWHGMLPANEAASDRATIELRNMVTVGRLMSEAALTREESRGAHYRTDFPEPRPEWQRHIVLRTR
jgi:L-aspartate oxidase